MPYYRSLFFIAFSLVTVCSLSAQPAIEWEKSLGGSGHDFGYSIANTFDGGFIVAGSTDSKDGHVSGLHDTAGGKTDAWIVKLNSAGTIEWQKTFGGSKEDVAHCIIQTKDSGYAFAGWTKSTDGDVTGLHDTNFDFWVVKISNAGSLEWQKTYGGSRYDNAYSIIQTSDDGFAVAGGTTSDDGDVVGYHPDSAKIFYDDVWIIKLDSVGNLQWQKTLGGTSGESASSISQLYDGGYAVSAPTHSNDGDVTGLHANGPDYWVLKLSEDGSLLGQKTYGGSAFDLPRSIIQTFDSSLVVAGYTNSYDGDVGNRDRSPGDLWVLDINDTGKINWKQDYGGSRESQATSVIQTQDSGFAIAGWVEGPTDLLVEKLSKTGSLQWTKTFGGTKWDAANSIVQAPDGGFAIVGFTGSNDGDVTGFHGDTDIWVVKLLPYTNSVSSAPLHATEISLFPTPNNGIGKIQYALENSSQIHIEVYDAIGRLVLVVADDFEGSGIHENAFDLSKFPSGQYFFRLKSEGILAIQGFELIH